MRTFVTERGETEAILKDQSVGPKMEKFQTILLRNRMEICVLEEEINNRESTQLYLHFHIDGVSLHPTSAWGLHTRR
jgi:hypothetical protein